MSATYLLIEEAKLMDQEKAFREVRNELNKATSKHGPMISPHEGYAVLLEEVDELWDEVKIKQSKHSKQRMREEACQVASMAIRFMMDLT